MIQFFRDGGWSMFVITGFGLLALGTAAFHAARPDRRHQGFLEWMSRALQAATLAGVASDFGATFHTASGIQDANERMRVTAEGLGESMSPAVMGFVVLALTAFLAAIGRRRLDARVP